MERDKAAPAVARKICADIYVEKDMGLVDPAIPSTASTNLSQDRDGGDEIQEGGTSSTRKNLVFRFLIRFAAWISLLTARFILPPEPKAVDENKSEANSVRWSINHAPRDPFNTAFNIPKDLLEAALSRIAAVSSYDGPGGCGVLVTEYNAPQKTYVLAPKYLIDTKYGGYRSSESFRGEDETFYEIVLKPAATESAASACFQEQTVQIFDMKFFNDPFFSVPPPLTRSLYKEGESEIPNPPLPVEDIEMHALVPGVDRIRTYGRAAGRSVWKNPGLTFLWNAHSEDQLAAPC